MAAPNVAGKRFGKYELLAPLAAGGTAEVYLARIVGEAGFEKIVVVKRLLEHLADDREFVNMFLDEARLGARLDHSNIVQTLELGEVDGRYFIAMEYLAGLSLAHLAGKAQMRVAGGLPLDLSLAVIAQAASGLHYAHQCALPDGTPLKIVHRDVSPQNLVVTFEGEVKIVDFGIAHAAQREAHTKSGFIKGKFAYMAPEQCLGKPLDRRTDIFALGVILHELATGRRLFKRESTYATYQAIVKGEVPRPSQVNPQLDASIDEVIMRALAYDAAKRYPTAEEMAESIHSCLHRRGRRVSSGDLGRFVERWFQPELDEHAQRMTALMSGSSVTTSLTLWDADGEELATDAGEDEAGKTSVDPIPAPLPPVPPAGGGVPAAARPSGSRPVAKAAPDAATSYPLPGATPAYPPPPPRPSQQQAAQRVSKQQPAQSGRGVDAFAATMAALPAQTPPPSLLRDLESGPAQRQSTPQPVAPGPPAMPRPSTQQPVEPVSLTPSAPLTPVPGSLTAGAGFADGSYSDAQRLATEKPQQGPKLWLYPVVFVLAAGVGVGALLLFNALR